MPAWVDVRDAKTHFSKMLARVMRGEEIVIARSGKPLARLIPERSPVPTGRVPGIDKGNLKIADDFDKLSKSELDAWYGPTVLPK